MSFFRINPNEYFTLDSRGYAHHETLRSSTRYIPPCRTLVEEAQDGTTASRYRRRANQDDEDSNNNGTSNSGDNDDDQFNNNNNNTFMAGAGNNQQHHHQQERRKRNFFNSETSVSIYHDPLYFVDDEFHFLPSSSKNNNNETNNNSNAATKNNHRRNYNNNTSLNNNFSGRKESKYDPHNVDMAKRLRQEEYMKRFSSNNNNNNNENNHDEKKRLLHPHIFIPTRGSLIPPNYRSLHADISFREFERAKKECQDAVDDISRLVIERRIYLYLKHQHEKDRLEDKEKRRRRRRQQRMNQMSSAKGSTTEGLFNRLMHGDEFDDNESNFSGRFDRDSDDTDDNSSDDDDYYSSDPLKKLSQSSLSSSRTNAANANNNNEENHFLEAKFVDNDFFVTDEKNVRGFFDENVDSENEDESDSDDDDSENEDEDGQQDDNNNNNQTGGRRSSTTTSSIEGTDVEQTTGFNLVSDKNHHPHPHRIYDNTGMNLDDVLDKYGMNSNNNNRKDFGKGNTFTTTSSSANKKMLMSSPFAKGSLESKIDVGSSEWLALPKHQQQKMLLESLKQAEQRNQEELMQMTKQRQRQELSEAERASSTSSKTQMMKEFLNSHNNNSSNNRNGDNGKSKNKKRNVSSDNKSSSSKRHHHVNTSRKIPLPENVARMTEIYPNAALFESFLLDDNYENNNNSASFSSSFASSSNIRLSSIWTTGDHCKNAHVSSAVHSLILANRLEFATLGQSEVAYGNFSSQHHQNACMVGDLLKGTEYEHDLMDYQRAGSSLNNAKSGQQQQLPAFSPAASTWAYAAYELKNNNGVPVNKRNQFNLENHFVLPDIDDIANKMIEVIEKEEAGLYNNNNSNNEDGNNETKNHHHHHHNHNSNRLRKQLLNRKRKLLDDARLFDDLGAIGVVLYANQHWTWVIVDDLIATDRSMTTPWFLRPLPKHPSPVVAVESSLSRFSDHFFRLVGQRFEQNAYIRSHLREPNETWPLIFEKALGKLFGSYSMLSAGTSREILETVTGPFSGEIYCTTFSDLDASIISMANGGTGSGAKKAYGSSNSSSDNSYSTSQHPVTSPPSVAKLTSEFILNERLHHQNYYSSSSNVPRSFISGNDGSNQKFLYQQLLFKFSSALPSQLGGDDIWFMTEVEKFQQLLAQRATRSLLSGSSSNSNNKTSKMKKKLHSSLLYTSADVSTTAKSTEEAISLTSLSNYKLDQERNRKKIRYPSASLDVLLKSIRAKDSLNEHAGGQFYSEQQKNGKNSSSTTGNNSGSDKKTPLDIFNELAAILEKQLGRRIIASARVKGGRDFSLSVNKAHEVAFVFHTANNKHYSSFSATSSNSNNKNRSNSSTIAGEETPEDREIRARVQQIYKFIPFCELPIVGVTRNSSDETFNSIEFFDPWIDELDLMEARFQGTQISIREAEEAAGGGAGAGSGGGGGGGGDFSSMHHGGVDNSSNNIHHTASSRNLFSMNSAAANNNDTSFSSAASGTAARLNQKHLPSKLRRKHQLSQGFGARIRSVPWLIACEIFESISLSFVLDEPKFLQANMMVPRNNDINNYSSTAEKAKVILDDEHVLWHVTTIREVAPPTTKKGKDDGGNGNGDDFGDSDDDLTGGSSNTNIMTDIDEMIRNYSLMPGGTAGSGLVLAEEEEMMANNNNKNNADDLDNNNQEKSASSSLRDKRQMKKLLLQHHQRIQQQQNQASSGKYSSSLSSSNRNSSGGNSSSTSSAFQNKLLRQAPVIPFVLHYRSAADTVLSLCLEQEDLRMVQTATRLQQGSLNSLDTQRDLQDGQEDEDDYFSPLRGRHSGVPMARPRSAQERKRQMDEQSLNFGQSKVPLKSHQYRADTSSVLYDQESRNAQVLYNQTNKNVFPSHSPPLHFLRLVVFDFGKTNPEEALKQIQKDHHGVFSIQQCLDELIFGSDRYNSSSSKNMLIKGVQITEVQYGRSLTVSDFAATAESYYAVFPFVLKGPAASFCVRILSPSISDIAVWQLPVPSILTILMLNGIRSSFGGGDATTSHHHNNTTENSSSSSSSKMALLRKRKSEKQLLREQKREDRLRQQLARFTSTATGRVLKSDALSLVAMLQNSVVLIENQQQQHNQLLRAEEKGQGSSIGVLADTNNIDPVTFPPNNSEDEDSQEQHQPFSSARPFTKVAPARVGVHTSCLPRPAATAIADPNVIAARKFLKNLERKQQEQQQQQEQEESGEVQYLTIGDNRHSNNINNTNSVVENISFRSNNSGSTSQIGNTPNSNTALQLSVQDSRGTFFVNTSKPMNSDEDDNNNNDDNACGITYNTTDFKVTEGFAQENPFLTKSGKDNNNNNNDNDDVRSYHQKLQSSANKMFVVGADHAFSDADDDDNNAENMMTLGDPNNNTKNYSELFDENGIVIHHRDGQRMDTTNNNNNNNTNDRRNVIPNHDGDHHQHHQNQRHLEVTPDLLSGIRKSFDLADLEGNGSLREPHQIRRALESFLLKHTPLGQALSEKFGLTTEKKKEETTNTNMTSNAVTRENSGQSHSRLTVNSRIGATASSLGTSFNPKSGPGGSVKPSPQKQTSFTEDEFCEAVLECI